MMLIIAPYARRISSDIKHLSGDMALIAGGDLTREVKLKGKTELAELAQSFDQMRQAIAARMERESEAVRANQELIAALSHDLRTPLTKQSQLPGTGAGRALSRGRQGHARLRGKRRPRPRANCANALRSCFPTSSSFPGKRGPGPVLEEVDGTQLLTRLLCEQAEFLRVRGFAVDSQAVPEGLKLRVYLPGLTRIFDKHAI